ncbi:1, 4-alpha-D-glucan glucohydrolase [Amylocarpus encephaloides]|uniref:Glucoamylase n=1 Tax=Amylocarpus encephaloides TaxID=45428 RepID=A0A9P7YBE7_9HELO|nr:1, 4-alpha-D-glucan glucohydrolase [Amylocarpus encephaloides]
MRFSPSVVGILSIASQALAVPNIQARDVSSFIATQKDIALKGVLDNIGANGSEVTGAGQGIIIASPSKSEPDYFFTWTRDSALTMKMIIDDFIAGNQGLETTINDYIKSQAILQTVTNPSGSLLPAGAGLGEPKFLADGSRFTGAWGRPQRDGPALRAIALITYCNWLIQNGQSQRARSIIWPIISNDLSYVGQYWNSTGFDLWEEVQGSSFFTVQNQHRSLVEGTKLARDLRVTCTGCDQAPQVLCFLQTFWNGKYIVSNINDNAGRTGIDGNSILGPISVFDINAYCDSLTFQPCNSKSLANFKVLIDTMRATYSINKGIPVGQGVAVGRYSEDTYYGGNPWYLITTAAAEFLYDAVAQWRARHVLYVDETSLAFFKELYPDVVVRQYNSGNYNSPFEKMMRAVLAYADSFVAVAQKYTLEDGALAEQYNRDTGVPLSARDLTWSYAAFVTMANARNGQYPPTWNTRQAAAPPATCASTSTPGVYAPATAAGAPNITTTCQVNVVFNVNATTYFGENIYIIGNTTDIGEWVINSAFPLTAGGYTAERPLWSVSAFLAAGENINYKYIRQQNCDQPYVYESQNRTLTMPACGSPAITVEDAWVGPVGTPGTC